MNYVCTRCLTVGNPKTYTKGSIGWEIVLWLLFLIPGIFYSIWRLTTRYKGCRACGAAELVPANSPAAQRLIG